MPEAVNWGLSNTNVAQLFRFTFKAGTPKSRATGIDRNLRQFDEMSRIMDLELNKHLRRLFQPGDRDESPRNATLVLRSMS